MPHTTRTTITVLNFFNNVGTKLNDEQELEIEALLEQALKNDAMQCVSSERLGKAERINDAAGRYIEFLQRHICQRLNP